MNSADTPQSDDLVGSVTFLTDNEEDLFSTGEAWKVYDDDYVLRTYGPMPSDRNFSRD